MWLSTVVLVLLSASVSIGIKLPPYFKQCRYNASDIGQCIGDAGSRVIPKLVKGNADFGFPPLTPFKFPNVYSSGDSGFKFELVDGIAGDLEDVRYLHSTFNRKTKKTNSTAFLPELYVRGFYTIEGIVNNIAIYGSGFADITFVDVACDMYWNLTKTIRHGIDYVRTLDLGIKYEIKGAKYSLSDLYNGDGILGAAANRHLNEHWQTLARIIAPTVLEEFRKISLYISRGVAEKLPLHEMFDLYS